ncbi:hypothetical protein BWQ96_10068 [Gracilariopsis chorda]|uniref:BZIP domain-containing protein n=1 Tax=Gracilariopsis chorda TaxID=448386 RepID=A0A2V3IGF3_9FLOR|nr:hypothetical protein BWQ96_10068 [Gracilariopsis chorda]|eukprot:PXF40230.1 hypothetical protein BWQ96_10068 [Gracilariopsis chorda]
MFCGHDGQCGCFVNQYVMPPLTAQPQPQPEMHDNLLDTAFQTPLLDEACLLPTTATAAAPLPAPFATAPQQPADAAACDVRRNRAPKRTASQLAYDKRQARILRNRESARRSRLRSKLRVQGLESAFASMSSENDALRNCVRQLLPVCLQRCPRLSGRLMHLLRDAQLVDALDGAGAAFVPGSC